MSGCFDFLKKSLTTVPVLAYPDTSKPYILYMNASDNCIRGCIHQKQDSQGEMKSNEPNEKLFIICHINIELHRQTGLQLKKRLLLSFMLCSS